MVYRRGGIYSQSTTKAEILLREELFDESGYCRIKEWRLPVCERSSIMFFNVSTTSKAKVIIQLQVFQTEAWLS